mmetsp:Transcript_31205/g.60280  ORF Transcript_31205/g.60280 Transcript_31205/m.60280 type:complete len:654 (+) Transcript_31205:139-2100(+)
MAWMITRIFWFSAGILSDWRLWVVAVAAILCGLALRWYFQVRVAADAAEPDDFVGTWFEGAGLAQYPIYIRRGSSGLKLEYGPVTADLNLEGRVLVGQSFHGGHKSSIRRFTLQDGWITHSEEWPEQGKEQTRKYGRRVGPDIFVDDTMNKSPARFLPGISWLDSLGWSACQRRRPMARPLIREEPFNKVYNFNSDDNLGMIIDDMGTLLYLNPEGAAAASQMPLGCTVVSICGNALPSKPPEIDNMLTLAKNQGPDFTIECQICTDSGGSLIDEYVARAVQLMGVLAVFHATMMLSMGVVSWNLSSCHFGLPIWLSLGVPLYILCTWLAQKSLCQHFRKLGRKGSSDEFRSQWLKRSTVRSWGAAHMTWFAADSVPMLLLLGIAESYDVGSDGLMPGQVAACKQVTGARLEVYEHSLHQDPLNPLLHVMLLSGLGTIYAMVAVTAEAVQIGTAIWRIRKLSRAAIIDSTTEDSAAFDAAAEKMALIALIADALGMTYVARIWRITAADIAKMVYGLGTGADAVIGEEAREKSRTSQLAKDARIVFEISVTKVACEAAPALYLAITYIAMALHHLSMQSLAIAVFSLAASMATVAQRAFKAICAGTRATVAVGVCLIAYELIMTVKFAMVFVCASNFFNIATLSCAPKFTASE